MPRITEYGPTRPHLSTGALGYNPGTPTGPAEPDPPDFADGAAWYVPYISTADMDFVQSKTNVGIVSEATITTTFDSTPVQGNLLIAVIVRREVFSDVSLTGWTRYPDADGLLVTDEPGNPSGSNGSAHIFYKTAGASEPAAVTIDANGGANKALIIAEFSGATAFDAASNQSVTTPSTSVSTGNLTPAAGVTALLVGVIIQSSASTFTIGGSFTEIDQELCAGSVGPALLVGYRIVDPTSGAYAMTASSTENDTYAGMLLSFLTDDATEAWVDAFLVYDDDDATYDFALAQSVTAADLVFLRGSLAGDAILDSADLRLALEDAGSATVTVEGATDIDFTSPVELGSLTFTGTGSYTPQDITIPLSGDGYPFVRFLLDAAQGVRVHEITLNGVPSASVAIGEHLTDTTDAHDASAISVLDAGGHYTGTNVEAVLAEIAPIATGDLRWEPVTHNFGTGPELVWDGDDLVMEWKGY
jgi:hypothetical protein